MKGQTTEQHLFLASTPEKNLRDQVKTSKLHCFVCMSYILTFLIKEKVIMHKGQDNENTPFLSSILKESKGKTTKLHFFFVCMPYILTLFVREKVK